MEWVYFRVDSGKRFEEEYVRTDPDRRYVEYFGPTGGVWIRGHPRGLEILQNDLGEEVEFWEYYKQWPGFYVRLNYDLMVAEYFSDSERTWVRRDELALAIVFKATALRSPKPRPSMRSTPVEADVTAVADVEWEYYQMWWDCDFVRIDNDNGHAEIWEVTENTWVRQDAWYPSVAFGGDGAPVEDSVALAAVNQFMANQSNPPESHHE